MADLMFNSATLWLSRLRQGDQTAAQQLWEEYYCRLVTLARNRLAGRTRLAGDEEDVALSAIKSFCRGIENGRYPQLADRHGLWNLLVTIAWHKTLHLVRDEKRAKRGGGLRRIGAHDRDQGGDDLITSIVSEEPTPDFALQFVEEAEMLLGRLPDQELVDLALLKMEGYTNEEIAVQWKRSPRTVERKLKRIRQLWSDSCDRTSERMPPPAEAKIVIRVASGPHAGQQFELALDTTLLVGRGTAAQLRLPEADHSLSRVHFRVDVTAEGCRLTNLSAKNGTYVNGQQVLVTDLRDGDVILAGETALRVSVQPTDAD